METANRMEKYFKIEEGKLYDEKYCRDNVCIVFHVNCVAIKGYGASYYLGKKYPYADVYRSREPLFNLRRCRVEDRDTPGNVIEFEPSPDQRKLNLPYLAAIISQFGIAGPLEENTISQNLIEKSRDAHLVYGLKKDTIADRIRYFKESIERLIKSVKDNKNIREVIFLKGIGRYETSNDYIWNTHYKPILEDMIMKFKEEGIRSTMVVKEEMKNINQGQELEDDSKLLSSRIEGSAWYPS